MYFGNDLKIKKIKAILLLLICVIIAISLFLLYLSSTQKQQSNLSLTSINLINDKGQSIPVEAEVATTPHEQEIGLMYRKSMDQNHGMIFIFSRSDNLAFWMKNTLIPLDIVYLDENLNIVNIIKNAQPCISDPCPSYYSKSDAKYALELNGGWADLNHTSIGNHIVINSK